MRRCAPRCSDGAPSLLSLCPSLSKTALPGSVGLCVRQGTRRFALLVAIVGQLSGTCGEKVEEGAGKQGAALFACGGGSQT